MAGDAQSHPALTLAGQSKEEGPLKLENTVTVLTTVSGRRREPLVSPLMQGAIRDREGDSYSSLSRAGHSCLVLDGGRPAAQSHRDVGPVLGRLRYPLVRSHEFIVAAG